MTTYHPVPENSPRRLASSWATQWWSPTLGGVVDHHGVAQDEADLRGQFSGTGWYVVVGTVAGLLAGALAAVLLDRIPLVTLLAVVVGSGIAGLIAALHAIDRGCRVTLVTKDVLEHANTRFAQGGIDHPSSAERVR